MLGLRPSRVLLVEDNPPDMRLLQEGLRASNDLCEIYATTNGAEALDFLFHRNEHVDKPRPDLILLDINLPILSGHHVLESIKNEPRLMQIPVVMLTTSGSKQDIRAAYDRRANAYVEKPSELDDYLDMLTGLKKFWLNIVQLPNARA
jgi:two-component system, chemotaxis family, response regulator Rcp1